MHLVLLMLLMPLVGAVREFMFVQIASNDHEYIPPTGVLESGHAINAIGCAIDCLSIPDCTSYNTRPEANGKVKCDFLFSIPTSPEMDLRYQEGSTYFEKSCQLFFKPNVVVAREDLNGVFMPHSVYITANSVDVYIVNFTSTYDVAHMTYAAPVSTMTSGLADEASGYGGVIFYPGTRFRVYLVDDGVICINHTSGVDDNPCFGDTIVSKVSLFGTSDVNALLPTQGTTGLYAFGQSMITIMDVTPMGSWTISSTIDLSPGNRPSGWKNIPRGIVGAGWMVERDTSGNDVFEKALLLTSSYYVVYHFPTDTIVKRGHLCLDP